MQSLSEKFKKLAIGIILWQFVDVILHIALGLPEPLRIAASIIIVGWIGATLAGKLRDKFQPVASVQLALMRCSISSFFSPKIF